MAKVMLVIDDYNELVFLETLLKRMGFDVLSLNKDSAVADAVLGFYPDLIIATFKGRAVDGLKLATKLKGQGARTRFALLLSQGQSPTLAGEQKNKVDGFLTIPVNAAEVLSLLAQLLQMDGPALLEKFEKLKKAGEARPDEVFILKDREKPAVDPGRSPEDRPSPALREKTEREKRYDKFLSENSDPVDKVLSHTRMMEAAKRLREASRDEEADLEEINRQKREFVIAMVKKDKR